MVHMIYCLMVANENQKVDAKLIKSLETKKDEEKDEEKDKAWP